MGIDFVRECAKILHMISDPSNKKSLTHCWPLIPNLLAALFRSALFTVAKVPNTTSFKMKLANEVMMTKECK